MVRLSGNHSWWGRAVNAIVTDWLATVVWFEQIDSQSELATRTNWV